MTTPETGALSPDPSGTPERTIRTDAEEAGSDLGRTVAALADENLEPDRRRKLLGRLVDDIRRRGLGQVFRPTAALRWMADVVGDIAPHVPVRDLDTLREHFDGMDGDELADRLIRNASRASAGIGAVGGGVASLQWAVTPTLLTAPVLLTAETIAVVAIELKLIGELHAAYRQPVPGNGAERATAMIQSWAGQRGVNPMVPGVGVASVLGTSARKDLQTSLLKRFGRHLTTLGPLLTGAAVASYLNRLATRRLGEELQKDLRRKSKSLPID